MLYINSKGHGISIWVDGDFPDKIGRICYVICVQDLATQESFTLNRQFGFISDLPLEEVYEQFCSDALKRMAKEAYDMRYVAGSVESCIAEDYAKYFRCADFNEIKECVLNFAKIVEPDETKWAELAQVQE